LDATGAGRIDVDDDRHARDTGRLGMAHRERVDVEGAAPEERRHPVEHAGLVLDVDNESVEHDSCLNRGQGPGARGQGPEASSIGSERSTGPWPLIPSPFTVR